MQSLLDRLTDKQAIKVIDQIGDLFKTLPKLPANLIDFLVKVIPYLALIGAVLSIVAGPFVGLLGTLGSLLAINPLLLLSTLVSVIFLVIQAIILFMAFGPLQKREMKGWIYLFWAEVLGFVQSFILGITSVGAIVWAVVWFGFWLYILFQMRPRYE